MNVTKTAKQIKALLVKMAINDTLPMDMTQLPLKRIETILKRNNKLSRVDKAAQILVADGDKEIKKMIKLVEAADEDELIDYIDGVEVWEKVEFSFTVKSFLQEIS